MTESNRDRELIKTVLGPSEPEIGCDECFDLLDQYVDLEINGEDAAARLPRAHAHFEGCPVCRDEYDSLIELVGKSDPAGPAGSSV